MDVFLKSKGFSRGRPIDAVIVSEMHTDTAVVVAQCTVETFDENDDDLKQFVYPMVFKLKLTKIGWTIN